MKRKVENDDEFSSKKQKICRKRCRDEETVIPNFKKLKINNECDDKKYLENYKQYRRDIMLYT